jgi:hypothetical protein
MPMYNDAYIIHIECKVARHAAEAHVQLPQ